MKQRRAACPCGGTEPACWVLLRGRVGPGRTAGSCPRLRSRIHGKLKGEARASQTLASIGITWGSPGLNFRFGAGLRGFRCSTSNERDRPRLRWGDVRPQRSLHRAGARGPHLVVVQQGAQGGRSLCGSWLPVGGVGFESVMEQAWCLTRGMQLTIVDYFK